MARNFPVQVYLVVTVGEGDGNPVVVFDIIVPVLNIL